MDYKEEIINIIKKIENEEFIIFVYKFILRLKGNWGV